MEFNSEKVKLIVSVGLLASNVIVLGLSGLAMAQLPPAGQIGKLQTGLPQVGPGTVSGLVVLLGAVVRWVYIIFFIIAVFFILWAAFTYLTAGGNPDSVATAKNRLIYAAIAIVIAFLAVGFEQIIGTFLTTPNA